jgi:glycosyltransferase involved in cell wall biosynthesis
VRVLSFSYCFPQESSPTWGVFVYQRLSALSELTDLRVASPVPAFPLLTRLRGPWPPREERWESLDVYRPRFFYLPGVLKSQDARLYGMGLRRWLERLCEDWRPDVLDAHFIWPDGVGVSRLARKLGIPYSVTLRGKIYPCLEIPSQRQQCAEALRGAASVISVSGPMLTIARELGADPERLHLIPNGVDTQHFHPGDKAEARRRLSLPDDGRLLVSVAHLGPRKGHTESIHALAMLPADVRLVLVGGDSEDNERVLRSLVSQLGLVDRVIFAGRRPYEEVPFFLNAADVGVLASHREGCPNAVLESLASGRPVVATDVGAVPDLVRDGTDGRVTPPRDIEALAQALRDVLEREWSAQTLAEAPAVKSWKQVAEEVHGVLSRVVEPETPRGKGETLT